MGKVQLRDAKGRVVWVDENAVAGSKPADPPPTTAASSSSSTPASRPAVEKRKADDWTDEFFGGELDELDDDELG